MGLEVALIFGLVALFGGAISYGSAENTNRTNRDIARETNEQNYRIWQEQKQHNEEMYDKQVEDNIEFWNMQNEYNLPANQVQRYRDAGLNPSLAMSGSNTGNIASSISTPQMQNAQPPTMQGYQYTSPLGGALNSIMQMLPMMSGLMNDTSNRAFTDSQTNQNNLFTPLIEQGMKFSNESKRIFNEWQPKLLEQDFTSKWLQNFYDDKTMFDRIGMIQDMRFKMQAETRLTNVNADTAEVLNQFVEPQQHLALMEQIERIAHIKAERKVSEKTIDVMISQCASNYANARQANSVANLNDQTYQFNEETKDIRVEGLNLANTGQSLDNQNKEYAVSKVKQTIESEVARINMENNLKKITSEVDSEITGKYTWSRMMEHNTRWLKGWFGQK